MNSGPVPVVLSCPHGGLAIPPEVSELLAIDETAIYNECDLWVEQLYDFAPNGAIPLAKVTMPIARVLVDANRSPLELSNPDGPVKTITSYGNGIYRDPLRSEIKEALLDRYWRAYHSDLDHAIERFGAEAKLLLDCHNMAQQGPSAYADPDVARPYICLADLGDERGERRSELEEVSCPGWLLRQAADIAERLFSDLDLLEPMPGVSPNIVGLNRPYPGGYILRQAAAGKRFSGSEAVAEQRPKLPAMMVEVNRGLYIGNQTRETPVQPPNLPRIALIQTRIYEWVTQVLALL